MSDQDSVCPFGQSDAESPTRLRARAKITVQSSEAEPYDQTASPALVEVHLTEMFVGDIEGESPVRALQILRDDKSASLVSVQRFRGKLGGRQGTFVLQGSEIVENGKIKARLPESVGLMQGLAPGRPSRRNRVARNRRRLAAGRHCRRRRTRSAARQKQRQ
jgi:Protein of unknown function (DUF3224)